MAKKKGKKAQPVQMPKPESMSMTITVDPWEVALGHQPHASGAGVHQDARKKRNKTRSAQLRRCLAEW
jgi:hypothetical protein